MERMEANNVAKCTCVAEQKLSAYVECRQATSTGYHTTGQRTRRRMLTSASMVSKHPQDGAEFALRVYIAACSMTRYLHISSDALTNCAFTVSSVFCKLSNNDWLCNKLWWKCPSMLA